MGERARAIRDAVERRLVILAVAGTAVLLPLVLARVAGSVYPLELLTHFQLQYFLGGLTCAAVLAGVRRFRWAGVAALAAALAGSSLLPYVGGSLSGPAYARTAGPRGELRVMLCNVLRANRETGRLLEAIAGASPDVIVLQEVDASWMSALEPLRTEYPFVASGPREDNFGIAIFSRAPLDDARVEHLGAAGIPSIAATVATDAAPVTLIATHPVTPLVARKFALRNGQLREVAAFAREETRPLVVIGDLNATMWSPWFKRLRRDLGLVDARRGFGVMPSWPTFLPPPCRIPIDHCLVSPGLEVVDCRLGPRVGSDHLPLIVDLALR